MHTTQWKTGLFYRPFNHKDFCYLYESKDIGQILQIWYNMIATNEKPFFAYKNHQLGNILKECDIPCIDLDSKEFNFPSYQELQKKYGDNYICAYHKKPKYNSNIIFTCAYRKCSHIYREIKYNLEDLMDL